MFMPFRCLVDVDIHHCPTREIVIIKSDYRSTNLDWKFYIANINILTTSFEYIQNARIVVWTK
jgi:hypothetical protein